MRSINVIYPFVVWALLLSCSRDRQLRNVDLAAGIDTLTARQIDTMKWAAVSVASYNKLTDYALQLLNDSLDVANRSKGRIILAVSARHIKEAIVSKDLDPATVEMKALLKRYNNLSFFIYQPPIPEFLKLMNRACSGDYPYIIGRFRQRWYCWPVLVVGTAFLIFTIVNLFGIIKWKYRKVSAIICCSLIIGVVAACILFKKTCVNNVSQDSFYGISF